MGLTKTIRIPIYSLFTCSQSTSRSVVASSAPARVLVVPEYHGPNTMTGFYAAGNAITSMGCFQRIVPAVKTENAPIDSSPCLSHH